MKGILLAVSLSLFVAACATTANKSNDQGGVYTLYQVSMHVTSSLLCRQERELRDAKAALQERGPPAYSEEIEKLIKKEEGTCIFVDDVLVNGFFVMEVIPVSYHGREFIGYLVGFFKFGRFWYALIYSKEKNGGSDAKDGKETPKAHI